MMKAKGYLDLTSWRAGLINAVVENAITCPVIRDRNWVVHVYVDKDADEQGSQPSSTMLKPVVLLSAMPWKCLLVHEDKAASFLPSLEKCWLQSMGSWMETIQFRLDSTAESVCFEVRAAEDRTLTPKF